MHVFGSYGGLRFTSLQAVPMRIFLPSEWSLRHADRTHGVLPHRYGLPTRSNSFTTPSCMRGDTTKKGQSMSVKHRAVSPVERTLILRSSACKEGRFTQHFAARECFFKVRRYRKVPARVVSGGVTLMLNPVHHVLFAFVVFGRAPDAGRKRRDIC